MNSPFRTRRSKIVASVVGGVVGVGVVLGVIGAVFGPDDPPAASQPPATTTAAESTTTATTAPTTTRQPTTTTAPTTRQQTTQAPKPPPKPNRQDQDARYIATLDTQAGLDFFAPLDRGQLITLGHQACRDLRTIPAGKVDDNHVFPKAGAMMRAHPGMNMDQALQIYATANVVYCPDAK